jgi:hypothetical protein
MHFVGGRWALLRSTQVKLMMTDVEVMIGWNTRKDKLREFAELQHERGEMD